MLELQRHKQPLWLRLALGLQVAKAAAMGPRHDETLLDQAVTNPYLSAVKRDAASARKAGWFWSYKLSDLYVSASRLKDHLTQLLAQ